MSKGGSQVVSFWPPCPGGPPQPGWKSSKPGRGICLHRRSTAACGVWPFPTPTHVWALGGGRPNFFRQLPAALTGGGGAGCYQTVTGRLLPYSGAGCLLWEGLWLRVGSGWEGLWREEGKSGRSGLGETATAFMTVTSVGHCAGCVPHCASRGCGEIGCCPPGRARV